MTIPILEIHTAKRLNELSQQYIYWTISNKLGVDSSMDIIPEVHLWSYHKGAHYGATAWSKDSFSDALAKAEIELEKSLELLQGNLRGNKS